MADGKTITIAGHRVNKWAVYGGIGVAVVGGVLYLRRKSSGSSSGSAGNGAAIDPVTGLPYSMDNQVDPVTGMTYLQEAQQYGSVSAAEAAVGGGYGGVSGGGTGYSGTGYGTPTINGNAQGTGAAYATNADWAQAVIAALPSITGDSQSDVATAVAHYLAGLPLTPTQVNDIQVALAEFGPPPSGSFSIIGQGSGSGPVIQPYPLPPGSVPPTGSPPPASGRLTAPAGVHITINGKTGVRLQWTAVHGATGYVCECKQGGSNGTTVNGPFTVTGPVCNFGNLKTKTHYTALIWPSDTADPGGPNSNQPHAEYGFTTT